jgi:hypothetical protein
LYSAVSAGWPRGRRRNRGCIVDQEGGDAAVEETMLLQ